MFFQGDVNKMKRAKSLKILILTIIFGLTMILGLSFMNNGVNGASAVDGAKYFTYVKSSHVSSDVKLEDDVAKIPMKNGDVVEIANQMVIDDFAVNFAFPANATSVKVIAKTDAYYVTGNKKVVDTTTTYEEEIELSLLLAVKEGNLVAVYNEGAETSIGAYSDGMDVNVVLTLNDNYLDATVNTVAVPDADKVYYKVKNIDKVVADVGFEVATAEAFTDDVTLNVKAIDQKASDISGNYKQTFVLENNAIKTQAYPRITLNDSFFAGKKIAGYDNAVKDGELYKVNANTYSVTGNYSTASIKAKTADDLKDYVFIGGETGVSTKNIAFTLDQAKTKTDMTLVFASSDDTKVFEEYKVKVIDKDNDKNAPEYVVDADALESFKAALKKNLKKDDHFINIGSGQYLELPSMKSLVVDDLTSYENLSYTVNYKNPTNTSSYASALKVPVEVAGKFSVYVTFTDKSANSMQADDFYKIEDDEITVTYGVYKDYVFDFEIADDAPMTIEAVSQGAGCVDVPYTAGAFKITASAYTVTYKLYFSETQIEEDAEGWKQILSTTDVTNGLTSEYFTTEELETIAYNGNSTFTPDRLGYYKLVCEVNSSNSERSASKAVIINVNQTPTVVKPDSKWLQNNLWSVIFLSVGTLCLIGIIILLCIKPKTPEQVAEKKTLKVKKVKKNKKK